MIVIESAAGVPVVWLAADGRHDTRTGTDVVTPLTDAERDTLTRAAIADGIADIEAARQRILAGLCDVALVVGADTTPKGFLKPNKGERGDDPDWIEAQLVPVIKKRIHDATVLATEFQRLGITGSGREKRGEARS